MKNFKSCFAIGKTKETGWTFVSVVFNDGRLSISGVEGPKPSGDCLGGCGQIDIGGIEYIEYGNGFDSEKIANLANVWDRWHLNDMRAGCEHQRAEGWDNSRISEPCSACGYKYGTAWLKEEVPEKVLNWLLNIPSTAVLPRAWR